MDKEKGGVGSPEVGQGQFQVLHEWIVKTDKTDLVKFKKGY